MGAYIYGYPLVTMEMTRHVMTDVAAPPTSKAPMGQFADPKEYPNAAFQGCHCSECGHALGVNLPQDTAHPMTSIDSNGQPLSGGNRYMMRFDRGRFPRVNGF